MVNKAHLFDNKVKIEGQLSALNFIAILVNFEHKMKATLVEIRKLVFEPQLEPSWVPLPSPKATL